MPRRFAVDDEDTQALSVALGTDVVGTADADIAVDSGYADDDDDGRLAHQQETERTPAGLPRCRSPVPRGAVALAVAAVAPLQAAVAPAVGSGVRS